MPRTDNLSLNQALSQLIYQAWLHDVLNAWCDGALIIHNRISVQGGWHKPYTINITIGSHVEPTVAHDDHRIKNLVRVARHHASSMFSSNLDTRL